MTKSREELDLEKLVEIDGEFCVPSQVGEVRHVIDLGLFEAPRSPWYIVRKLLLFLPAMYLFILAVQLMKAGAAAIGPEIQGQFPFANGVSTLGFGWLGAYLVLSGSPVAATTVSLFGAGTLTKLQTFTMLSGSRLGASLVVLVTGFLYASRRKRAHRSDVLGIGTQAIMLSALVYLPGMLIGYGLLRTGWLDGIDWHSSAGLDAFLDRAWGPAADALASAVPGWALLPIGLGVILASFWLLDHVLPQVSSDRTASKRATWLRHKWTMFALGCLVAMLTLSVSVALTILIPLASRGLIKREEALPYILGANVMTLADTLVVAMLQPTEVAAQIVLALAMGVTLVSLGVLTIWYGPVTRAVSRLDDMIVTSNRRLALFVGTLFVLPISFLLSGLWIGPIVQP